MEATECKIEKCKRPYRAKGYCNVHYKKWRHGEFGKTRYKTCKAEGCIKPVYQGSVCEEHFGVKLPKPHHEAQNPAAQEAAPVSEKEAKAAAEGEKEAPEEKKETKPEPPEKS